MAVKVLFQKTFILGKPTVANFAEIIKITTMFIKATLQKWKKKELEIMHQKATYIYYFLIH